MVFGLRNGNKVVFLLCDGRGFNMSKYCLLSVCVCVCVLGVWVSRFSSPMDCSLVLVSLRTYVRGVLPVSLEHPTRTVLSMTSNVAVTTLAVLELGKGHYDYE